MIEFGTRILNLKRSLHHKVALAAAMAAAAAAAAASGSDPYETDGADDGAFLALADGWT